MTRRLTVSDGGAPRTLSAAPPPGVSRREPRPGENFPRRRPGETFAPYFFSLEPDQACAFAVVAHSMGVLPQSLFTHYIPVESADTPREGDDA